MSLREDLHGHIVTFNWRTESYRKCMSIWLKYYLKRFWSRPRLKALVTSIRYNYSLYIYILIVAVRFLETQCRETCFVSKFHTFYHHHIYLLVKELVRNNRIQWYNDGLPGLNTGFSACGLHFIVMWSVAMTTFVVGDKYLQHVNVNGYINCDLLQCKNFHQQMSYEQCLTDVTSGLAGTLCVRCVPIPC